MLDTTQQPMLAKLVRALPEGDYGTAFAASPRARAARRRAEGHPWEHGFLLGGGAMGRLKGAAGRWEQGMTIDWIALEPRRVCEVTYTQVDGRRLRHPAKLVRWRPDREPWSCRIEQLDEPLTTPDELLAG
jgi:ATP-dependent DNA ligase